MYLFVWGTIILLLITSETRPLPLHGIYPVLLYVRLAMAAKQCGSSEVDKR